MKNWGLYLVTEEKLSGGQSTLEVVEKAISGGIDVIQLRDKNKNLQERYHLGLKIRKLTERHNVDFIVNDRVDLVLALNADGVHLGQEDLPLKEARKILGKDKIIGISVSNCREAEEAVKDGANYLGVGAIYATDSKKTKKERSAIGLEALRKINQKVNIPLVAIGGLDENNLTDVIKAGADTIAVITAITRAADISGKVDSLKKQIKKIKGGK